MSVQTSSIFGEVAWVDPMASTQEHGSGGNTEGVVDHRVDTHMDIALELQTVEPTHDESEANFERYMVINGVLSQG